MIVDDGYPRTIRAELRAEKKFNFTPHPDYRLKAGQPSSWKLAHPEMFDAKRPFDQDRLQHLRLRLERYC